MMRKVIFNLKNRINQQWDYVKVLNVLSSLTFYERSFKFKMIMYHVLWIKSITDAYELNILFLICRLEIWLRMKTYFLFLLREIRQIKWSNFFSTHWYKCFEVYWEKKRCECHSENFNVNRKKARWVHDHFFWKCITTSKRDEIQLRILKKIQMNMFIELMRACELKIILKNSKSINKTSFVYLIMLKLQCQYFLMNLMSQ